jgi:hypothetical protein
MNRSVNIYCRTLLWGIFLSLGLGQVTLLQGQIKLHVNGKTSFGPIPMTPPGDRVLIDGGVDRALQLKVSQPINWFQSSSAIVSRQLTVSWAVRYNGADRFYVLGNGDVYARSVWQYSDSSLKHQIAAIASPLDRLQKLRGVTYAYKPEVPCDDCDAPSDDPSVRGRRYGLLAQEVEQVFPEMVTEDADHRKLVAYEQLIPVLVEAVKEQQAQIDAMQLEINKLKSKR